MAGNKNSKLLVAAGVGAGLAVGGLAALWAYSGTDEKQCHHDGGHRLHEGSTLNPSPVFSPDSGVLRGWSPEQLKLLKEMEVEFEGKKAIQGGHLGPSFYALRQEIVALRTLEKIDALKKDKIEELAKDFKEMRFGDYSKKSLQLAINIGEIEEREEDRIADVFDDPVFIQASKIYLIRYNPDPILRSMVIGATAKHKVHLKVINQFNLPAVLNFVRSKIARRSEQGFEFVDKENFVNDFRVQLETEVLAKFNASLDEVWAFCALEHLGEDKALWDTTVEEYAKMLKTFYQGQTLYFPGIKITG